MSKKMYKNLKLQQKFQIFFAEHGFEKVQSRSKYIVYYSTEKFYFLGSSGGVRVNNKNSAAGSRSVTDYFKRILNKWEADRKPTEKIDLETL